MLEVNNLKVDFNTPRGRLQAVRGVSLSLAKGDFLGIVGESGSGKSVTASSIMKLLPANAVMSGSIILSGENPLEMTPAELRAFRGRRIAMIFQEPGRSFDPIYNMSKTFLETFRTLSPGITEEESDARAVKLLEEVNLSKPAERLGNFPHQFSGGQLQRIMIALALASNPELLIADEPTTALDVTIQSEIVDLLMNLRKTRGMAIIFITHDIELVSNIADRIIVMYSGLVMEESSAADIMKNPMHPYTAGLLGSLPTFGDHYSRRKLVSIPGGIPDPVYPEPGCPFEPRCPFARPECRNRIPGLDRKDGRYRCVIDGAKEPGRNG
ncbi:MAG: ABC transporter ATP-binding protein [Spirochaetales bacterium]|uniref:ABC transporter ATP-binding protein n=1 Tax=Candidatus Thalassospirochaeta sargassi TaxID=3119039 RepID=A0AAJ1IDL8_9SPIO|nr:ABC transporter ATP-binding protein [Spirochaetales bacterium]